MDGSYGRTVSLFLRFRFFRLQLHGSVSTSISYLSIGLNVLGIVLGYLVAPVAVLIANIVILAAWIIPSRTIESQYR